MGYAGDFRGFYRKSLGQNENIIRYFEFDHIKSHENTLNELLDLNFGKDWRIFLLLYYSGPLCRHHCRYAPFDKVEDANLSWVKRKAYFARAKLILKTYFSQGYEATLTEIKADRYRFIWNKQYIISSDLFNLSLQNKMKSSQQEQIVLEEKQKVQQDKKQERKDIKVKYFELARQSEEICRKIAELESKDAFSEDEWQQLTELRNEDLRIQSKMEKLEIQVASLRD